jgi:hypothetical protein
LGHIRVSGVQGLQPASQTTWYLLRGYNVYHASTGESIIARMIGEGQDAKYVLYAVAYPEAFNAGVHEFDRDLRASRAYCEQIREIDDAVTQLGGYGHAVELREHSMVEELLEHDFASLMIDTTPSREPESTQGVCKDYSMSRKHLQHLHRTVLTF